MTAAKAAKRRRGQSTSDYYEGDYNIEPIHKPVYIYREKAYGIFRKLNHDEKPLKLLDIGCEEGDFALRLKSLGYDVYGLEIRRSAVRRARERGVKAFAGSAEEEFPFGNGTFDAVYAGDVIEHLYDTDFFIGEVRRVLKPAGVFVLTTPNLASLSNRVRLLFGKIPVGSEVRLGKDNAGHIRNYTFPALEQQLREHNFSIIKKLSSNVMFPVKYNIPLLRSLAIRLGDYFPNTGSHIIMACRNRDNSVVSTQHR
ncbi:methyltransferase domain-containing protein [Candidatus Woesearchaeota archaeon]|nr:methyltransferase domain-containing protein [Candidatus Woesearchaeota archaeon]